jgi:hypothetical protein
MWSKYDAKCYGPIEIALSHCYYATRDGDRCWGDSELRIVKKYGLGYLLPVSIKNIPV